ncbi:N-acetylmuramoyl-L-alanine amidase [Clostridium sp.]|uniref:N-acetylmuramoyl-L-alanine amidase family protein n=1 Tax=Clostridium sp. TaxID=1506 RepID=UPI0032168036
MANNIVCLDAGHGGSDPGASYGKLIEKDIVLIATLSCRNVLTEHGVQVVLTRNTDVYVGLSQRAQIANNAKANYFVSIHCNAGGGDRGEVINSIYRGKGLELSNKIAAEMKAIGQDTVKQYDKKGDGGTDYYAVIRETNMDAIIVECAFLDNTTDNQIIDTVAEQEMFGVAIAKGILKQLGIGYKGSTQEKPSKPSTPVIKEEKKVDYIIQYSNATDQAIAEVMADRLNCPTINCLRPYAHYGQYKTVIAVGQAKNKSGHTNVLIQGKSRQETLDKAIAYCKKLGR